MNFRNFLRTVAVAFVFSIASTSSATAILQVNSDGILTGATGVDVGGTLYDVTFIDGSCNSLFNGCSSASFTFTSINTALAAQRALNSQVLIDGPAGQFDSRSDNLRGCTYNMFCDTVIPFARANSSGDVTIMMGFNPSTLYGGPSSISYSEMAASEDLGTFIGETFVIFTLSTDADTAVPEPGSIALMGLALVGLAFARRRRV